MSLFVGANSVKARGTRGRVERGDGYLFHQETELKIINL